MHLKESHGGSDRMGGGLWGVGSRQVGFFLAPPGLSFSSRTLYLLPWHPPHQSALCQEAAPELSVGSKRLRKQVRKNWSRTEGRWRAGSRRQAEGCQEELGMPGQHFSACLPGWPLPHQAWPGSSPAPHFPRLILPTLLRWGGIAGGAPWNRSQELQVPAPALPQPAS